MVATYFKENLTRRLDAQGIGSKSRLAEYLGVSYSYVSQLVSGDAVPNLERIEQIGEYFGVSAAAMLKKPAG